MSHFDNVEACATLYGADLSGVDFRGAILRECDFRGADLTGADFHGAVGTEIEALREQRDAIAATCDELRGDLRDEAESYAACTRARDDAEADLAALSDAAEELLRLHDLGIADDRWLRAVELVRARVRS